MRHPDGKNESSNVDASWLSNEWKERGRKKESRKRNRTPRKRDKCDATRYRVWDSNTLDFQGKKESTEICDM